VAKLLVYGHKMVVPLGPVFKWKLVGSADLFVFSNGCCLLDHLKTESLALGQVGFSDVQRSNLAIQD
jgi:hypothetical protein